MAQNSCLLASEYTLVLLIFISLWHFFEIEVEILLLSSRGMANLQRISESNIVKL